MNRILVVGPSWVGDMVMAQSLFKVIMREHPDATISVLAPGWSASVTDRMVEVTGNIAMPVGHGKLGLGSRWRIAKTLRDRFDRAIVLPGSLKSALVPWLARIPKRTGFIGEQRYGLLNDRRTLDKNKLPLNVQRFVALGLPSGSDVPALADIPFPAIRVDAEQAKRVATEFDLDPGRATTALCPGAEFGPAKQWPARHFAEVARHQLDAGRQVLILGSDKDCDIAASIAAKAPGCVDVTGKTNLGQAIDLMSLAQYVVSNDSGLMHIAAAVGCEVIALYGSSSSAFTPPLSTRATELSLDLSCQPCFQRTCPLGHLDCLNKLMPARVIEALS